MALDRSTSLLSTITPAERTRFAADLDRLCPAGERVGVGVSGGPDSLALLLLTASARPGEIEAATVDHRLRPESAAEAEAVAYLCERLGVAHATLPVKVAAGASLQGKAREARYRALGEWATKRGIASVLSAHHADDQAETLLMRLARGAGLGGLAGVRETRELVPGVRLVRPVLGWRKHELAELVDRAGLEAVDDPANYDPRHDRTAARVTLQRTPALDPQALAASAAWLGEVDAALRWTVEQLARDRLQREGERITLSIGELPPEYQRRLLLVAFSELGAPAPRGPDLHRALKQLAAGKRCTISGLILTGGERWTVQPEIRARRRKS